jgi:hypothetical protein
MRRVITAALLVAGISLSAASPAWAFHDFIIPARENGCGVDLHVQAEHLTDRVPIGNGDITITNLDTGASYLQRSRYTLTETVDPKTRSVHVTTIGRIWIALFAGDEGPTGVVQEPGLELLFSGTTEATFNKKNVITSFSYTGEYQDLCALLSD